MHEGFGAQQVRTRREPDDFEAEHELRIARVVVLHRGRVRAEGEVEDVVRQAGAADLAGAFARLTRGDEA